MDKLIISKEEYAELVECKIVLSAFKRIYQKEGWIFEKDVERLTGWAKEKEVEVIGGEA